MTPPPEVYERIKEDNKKIVRAREKNSDLDYFKNKFINPLEKYIVTGVYGSQRILNGKPRSPHYGMIFMPLREPLLRLCLMVRFRSLKKICITPEAQ